jgi:hypothetical protein
MRCKKKTGYEEAYHCEEEPKGAYENGQKAEEMAANQRPTLGLDLGDRTSRSCILNEAGEVVSEGQPADHANRIEFVMREDAVQPSGAGSGEGIRRG